MQIFPSTNYEHPFYCQYQACIQRYCFVADYIEEVYHLSSKVSLVESEVQLISRYVNGLQDDIKSELLLSTIGSLFEVVNLALKVEAKLANLFIQSSYQRKSTSNVS